MTRDPVQAWAPWLMIAVLAGSTCAIATSREDRMPVAAKAMCAPAPDPPTPFESDACTWFPDGKWASCCATHDVAYWRGGSWRERLAADGRLTSCMWDRGASVLAGVVWVGLRVGGHSLVPHPKRWGHGWSYPQGGPPRRACTSTPAAISRTLPPGSSSP
jgi:hypothetical protein